MSLAEQVIERIEVAGGVLTVRGDRIRCRLPEDAAHLLDDLKAHKSEVIACLKQRDVPKMPLGVTLIAWNPKRPPVGISYCTVVNAVEGLVADSLAQLGKLLNCAPRPETTRKLRDLVDALERCGVIVQIRRIGSLTGGRQ